MLQQAIMEPRMMPAPALPSIATAIVACASCISCASSGGPKVTVGTSASASSPRGVCGSRSSCHRRSYLGGVRGRGKKSIHPLSGARLLIAPKPSFICVALWNMAPKSRASLNSLFVIVDRPGYSHSLLLCVSIARDVLLAGNTTTISTNDSHSSLPASTVLGTNDFCLRGGAGQRNDCEQACNNNRSHSQYPLSLIACCGSAA